RADIWLSGGCRLPSGALSPSEPPLHALRIALLGRVVDVCRDKGSPAKRRGGCRRSRCCCNRRRAADYRPRTAARTLAFRGEPRPAQEHSVRLATRGMKPQVAVFVARLLLLIHAERSESQDAVSWQELQLDHASSGDSMVAELERCCRQ